jgi:hypothetical protein
LFRNHRSGALATLYEGVGSVKRHLEFASCQGSFSVHF